MKKNLLYALAIILMCAVVLWLAVMLVWSAGAAG